LTYHFFPKYALCAFQIKTPTLKSAAVLGTIIAFSSQKTYLHMSKQIYIGGKIVVADNVEQIIEMPIMVGTQLITDPENGIMIKSLSFDNVLEFC